MSYHGLGNFVPAQKPPTRLIPVSELARFALWKSGYPMVPRGAAYWRVVKAQSIPLGKLWIKFYDGRGLPMGVVVQYWMGHRPVAPEMKTPMVYTETGQWGPTVTPESEVGPVDVAFPYERVPWIDEDGSIFENEESLRVDFGSKTP